MAGKGDPAILILIPNLCWAWHSCLGVVSQCEFIALDAGFLKDNAGFLFISSPAISKFLRRPSQALLSPDYRQKLLSPP